MRKTHKLSCSTTAPPGQALLTFKQEGVLARASGDTLALLLHGLALLDHVPSEDYMFKLTVAVVEALEAGKLTANVGARGGWAGAWGWVWEFGRRKLDMSHPHQGRGDRPHD
jgi:hypothetical protein